MANKLFANWEPIAQALSDVRNDNTPTDFVLVGYSNTKMETLEYITSGQGGADEMKQSLSSDQALYGFVRVSERIDESDTIKFCFVKWVGNDLRPMSRAKLTPQVGDITARFKPYHVDVYCTEFSEISQEIVEGLVGKASMSKSAVIDNDRAKRIMDENEKKRRVVEERLNTPLNQSSGTTTSVVPTYGNNAAASAASPTQQLTADQQETLQKLEGFLNSGILTEEEFEAKKKQVLSSSPTTPTTPSAPSSTSSPTVAKKTAPVASVSSVASSSAANSGSSKNEIEAAMKRATLVRFPDADAIIDAIAQVRNDRSEIDWVLTGYTDLKQTKDMHIGLIGSGSGGVEELKQHLTDDNIYYGIVRMTDQIDNSITVKFVFIHFMGDGLKPMARARVTTHKLTVSEVFRPYHVDTFASKADELSQELLENLVGATSFSKSNVIDNDRARKIMDENESKRKAVEDKVIVM